jgi:hypothetical protein
VPDRSRLRARRQTPFWAEVDDVYDAARERIQVREYAVEAALRRLK